MLPTNACNVHVAKQLQLVVYLDLPLILQLLLPELDLQAVLCCCHCLLLHLLLTHRSQLQLLLQLCYLPLQQVRLHQRKQQMQPQGMSTCGLQGVEDVAMLFAPLLAPCVGPLRLHSSKRDLQASVSGFPASKFWVSCKQCCNCYSSD